MELGAACKPEWYLGVGVPFRILESPCTALRFGRFLRSAGLRPNFTRVSVFCQVRFVWNSRYPWLKKTFELVNPLASLVLLWYCVWNPKKEANAMETVKLTREMAERQESEGMIGALLDGSYALGADFLSRYAGANAD